MLSTRACWAVAAMSIILFLCYASQSVIISQVIDLRPLYQSDLTPANMREMSLTDKDTVPLGQTCHTRRPQRDDDWKYFLNEIIMHPLVYSSVNATNYTAELIGWTDAFGLYKKYVPELVQARKGKQERFVGVEVGTWAGKATYEMASVMKQHCAENCLLLAVDTWLGDPAMISSVNTHPLVLEMKSTGRLRIFDVFLKNMVATNVSDIVAPVRLPADMAASLLKCMRLTVDVIWIDTYQEYKQVREVIDAWWPLLKSGGYFFGSDYSKEWPAVIQAADDFVHEKKLILLDNSLNKGVWIVKKP